MRFSAFLSLFTADVFIYVFTLWSACIPCAAQCMGVWLKAGSAGQLVGQLLGRLLGCQGECHGKWCQVSREPQRGRGGSWCRWRLCCQRVHDPVQRCRQLEAHAGGAKVCGDSAWKHAGDAETRSKERARQGAQHDLVWQRLGNWRNVISQFLWFCVPFVNYSSVANDSDENMDSFKRSLILNILLKEETRYLLLLFFFVFTIFLFVEILKSFLILFHILKFCNILDIQIENRLIKKTYDKTLFLRQTWFSYY